MTQEEVKAEADAIVLDMLKCQSNTEELGDATQCALIAVRMVLDQLETMYALPTQGHHRMYKFQKIEKELKSRV